MVDCEGDGMVDCSTSSRMVATVATPTWNHCAYMRDQCQEIARHKWIESERAGRDLGDQAVRDWIARYAPTFRKAAEASGRYRSR